ncbi:hypothetical protein Tco_0099751 [Tanacetum coccineum]
MAIEESLKDAHGGPRGPLPPVVFRETDIGKFQPLPEVEGKGKEKVGAEQAAQVLLNLQTPKKKSPTEQYIFQRRTSAPTEPSGHDKYSSLYVALGLTESDTESDEEMPPVVKSGDQDEGQAGPDPGIQDIGQAEPNPDDVAESQPLSTPSVHAGPNLEHTDAEATDATSQPQPGQMDEEFTTTAYPNVQKNLKLTVDEPVIPEEPVSSTGTLLENQDIPNQVSKVVDEIVTDVVDWAMQETLRERFRHLPEADMKEILHNQMWESKSYQRHEDHMTLYEALEKSMARDNNDQLLSNLAEARKKKKKRQGLPKTPPGSPPHPPPPAGPSRTSGASSTSGSSQSPHPPPPPSNNQGDLSPLELHMDDDTTADEQAYSSSGEDIGRDHIPTVNLRQSWWKPLTEDQPATPESAWSIPLSDLTVPTNNWASALKSTYTPPPENSLLAQIGDMATFMDCSSLVPNGRMPQTSHRSSGRCNPKYGRKMGRHALSISKIKATYYPDVGLGQIQRFYIDRHISEGDRRAVRTHMCILSVVRIDVFPMYGYNYMKKIVLRRADLKEYVIAERDSKYLYPSDFEDLYLLNLQVHLNHLSPEDKKILTTAVNLWTRNLDAKGFEYKHDFTVIDSPRAVTFRDKYGVQMIMRFNEIYKFSDGTLQQIDEALDYKVKEFRVNRMNLGLDTRFWTKKDVDRSKEFMFSIQKRLKTRRIFQNLESFVGGRIREGDYRLLKRIE